MSSTYRVMTYEAHNVGGLKDVQFDLDGHHLFLVGGRNAQGKTSALNGLRMALCGKNGCDYPEVPLREGEREGWVKAQLASDLEEAGLSVELKFRRTRTGQVNEQFRIVDGTGAEVPSPRTLLQRLFSLRAFDPLAFERMSRKEKRETLLKLVGVDISEFKRKHDSLFAERTVAGREGKALAARVEAMPRHQDAPDAEVSVQKLVCERDRRQELNRQNQRERDRLKTAMAEEDRVRAGVTSLETELAAVQKRLEEARAQLEQAELLVNTQQKTVAVLEDADVVEVTRQLETAEETNRKVRENKARADAEEQLEAARHGYEALTDALDDVRRQQSEALERAQWPVDGLSFDDDGVLFRGLPIEQCSKRERIMVSTRIGMALNPRLRLLVSEGGGDMDEDSLAELDAILKKHDFQMVLELVTRGSEDESRCAVVIEDGEAKIDG